MDVTVGTIIGRDAELRQITRFLHEPAPAGAVLLLEGEPGIGKTTLWEAALQHAPSAAHVLRARPAESEARLAYTALADLLEPVYEDVRAELPGLQRDALDRALLRADEDEADRRTVATGLVSAAAALASTGGIVLALDDVQWLDRASRGALEFLARRLPTEARLLLTRRHERESAVPLGIDRLPPVVPVERILLGPLSLAGLHQLLADRLGLTLPRPTLIRLEQASGGNPFYALQIAAMLDEWSPTLGEALPLPTDLRDVLRRRLDRLPRESRHALLLTAAATRPTTADISEPALAPAVAEALVTVDQGRISFTHPLLASAVYTAASPAERREAHARLAAAADEVEERGRHAALAAVHPDAAVATLLDDAAASARRRGAPEEAGELQERAAELTPSDDRPARHRRTAAAAEHFFRGGDLGRAHALVERTLAETPGERTRGECLRLLGELRFNENSFPDAVTALEEALPLTDGAAAVAICQDLAFACLSMQRFDEALRHADAAVAAAAGAEDGVVAEALALATIIGHHAGQPVDHDLLDRALALEDPRRNVRLMMRPRSIAAMIASSEGRLAEASSRLRAVRDAAFERGEESELPLLLAYLAGTEWRRGSYDEAQRVVDDLLMIAAQAGNEPMRGIGLVHRGMVAALRGGVDDARAALDEAEELMARTGWALGGRYVCIVRGFLAVSVGDAPGAVAALEPLIAAVETGTYRDPAVFFVPDAVEALVATGARARAAALIARLEPAGYEWAEADLLRCRALLLADAGDLDAASVAATRAAAAAERLEQPLATARSWLTLGQIQRRRRRKRDARAALEQALRLCEELGTPLWAERVRAELARVGARAPEGGLTATERRIAELAATGLTNREIAQQAFVSPKTVEANLARVYRKLAISSRAELGARMAERAEK